MSIIQCPECQRYISENASFCAGCGMPLSGAKKNRPLGSQIILLTAFGLMSSALIVLLELL